VGIGNSKFLDYPSASERRREKVPGILNTDTAGHLKEFAAILWGQTARAAILWVQCQENNSQQLVANQHVAMDPAARIWVQSGKIMGFVARDGDVCRRRL
jgi:hypothetical protein